MLKVGDTVRDRGRVLTVVEIQTPDDVEVIGHVNRARELRRNGQHYLLLQAAKGRAAYGYLWPRSGQYWISESF